MFIWVEAKLPSKRARDPFLLTLVCSVTCYITWRLKAPKEKGLVLTLLFTVCEKLPVLLDLVETHG